MKRLLPLLLALLMLTPALAACNNTPDPTPEDPTQADTQTPDTPEVTEQYLDIVKDGASDYVIVRPADITAEDPAFVAAVLFRDAIERISGATLQIVTDDEADYAVSEKEILIGNARGATNIESTVYVSDSKLYIGGESQLLSDMVAAFFSACFTCDITSGELPALSTLSVPVSLTMDQAGNVTSTQVKQDTTAWGDTIAYADEVANLINFRYLDQKRDTAEITNGDIRLVYNLDVYENNQVAGLYNTSGAAYLTNSMDTFIVTANGTTLYSSQSGISARGNIYRFGYYYYDIHFLDQNYLPAGYDIDESAGSYDLLSKAKKKSKCGFKQTPNKKMHIYNKESLLLFSC